MHNSTIIIDDDITTTISESDISEEAESMREEYESVNDEDKNNYSIYFGF